MKKIVIAMIGIMAAVCYAVPDKVETIAYSPHTKTQVVYVHYSSDFNDANTCIFKNFYGSIIGYMIDANGTDTSYKVRFYIDPPEGLIASDQVVKSYLLKDLTCTTTAIDFYDEVINWSDVSANVYGSHIKVGDIWGGIKDANDATLDDLKLWLILELN